MMKQIPCILLLLLCMTSFSKAQNHNLEEVREAYENIGFSYQDVSGIGHEEGVTRRDPSDVIKVGDTYYVYYTKVYGRSPGYWGTLWYAISEDEGYTWTEQGEILGTGKVNAFDSQATFTPNILYAEGSYYLYYTGVKPTPGNEDGEFENNSVTDITAIGFAKSDSPDGPFVRVQEEPIVRVSVEPEKFDSYRVDDAALLYRNGLYWLYYKGRSLVDSDQGPLFTKMGVAFSKKPAGPFEKFGEPILDESHEVLIWRQSTGVGALASFSESLEYAPGGVDFLTDQLSVKVDNKPLAPGLYRPDLTNPNTSVNGMLWGISMIHNGAESYLTRFEIEEKN
jgi:hypothetical protein